MGEPRAWDERFDRSRHPSFTVKDPKRFEPVLQGLVTVAAGVVLGIAFVGAVYGLWRLQQKGKT